MPRLSRIAFCSLIALLLFSTAPCLASPRAGAESTAQTIDFLIGAVAQSHLTFIRNGEEHSCDEAVQHIKKKYEYFQAKVKTPEDFIRLCASKSLLSGSPYLVVTQRGTIPVEQWLEQKLAEHEGR